MKISVNQAIGSLWRRGVLAKMLLRPEQIEIYDLLREAKGVKYTLYAARRFGKTFICLLMVIEDCLRNNNWEVGFVAPTVKQLLRVSGPIFNTILKSCPKELKPIWKSKIGGYLFPSTGSLLFMSGTDNKHWEDLLGMNLHKGYFDEPGTMDDLAEIVNRVVTPMTMTTRADRGEACGIILLGTPSATPAHDYYFLKEECKANGNFALKTIWENTGLTKETKLMYIKEAGGENSTNARREFFCEDVVDTERAVIPEFNNEKEKKLCYEFERPPYFILCGALDPGFNNFTGYVLGYYDFLEAKIKIEGEVYLRKEPTPVIADAIKKLEKEMFPKVRDCLRYSDTEPQVICDLSRLHDLSFTATAKDGKEARINELRNIILQDKILIHPRCKYLILHLKTAIWNKPRTKFLETSDGAHFDMLDSLIYLVRNIDKYTNPYPAEYDHLTSENHHINPSVGINKEDEELKGIFGT